ncbi:MAG: hypothetical protein IKC63_04790 [Clostridia bacterium]|nr:hypothetical protein [Clostridia bacterium]
MWGYPERLVTDSAKKGAREKAAEGEETPAVTEEAAEGAKMTDEAVGGKPSLR